MVDTIRYPDGNVLLRNLTRTYPVISHGKGVYLFDRAGKRYFDGSSGALVTSIGHGNQEVASRIGEQLGKVAYVNGMQFTSEVAERAAAKLAVYARTGLGATAPKRSAFLGSGSEAVEAALKFARQLAVERGEAGRTKLIARAPGYHGNTMYALSASGRPHYKKWFGPMLSEVVVTPAPYAYRSPVADYEKDGAEHYAKELEAAISAAGGGHAVYAFLFEPVIGSSAGAATPPPGYFARVSEICRRHGILMIADEVLCGAGRTGRFFASEHYGYTPDIVVLGKGLGGGYVPVSAVMVREDHLAEMAKGSGYFMHAQTYLQAPSMAAAALATLDYYEAHGVLDNAARTGAVMQKLLRERLLGLPFVGNVAGIGMLAGVELVMDKAKKTPFARTQKIVEGLVQACFESGVIVWPNTGHADGTNGDLIMIGPPLIATVAEVEELCELLAAAMRRYLDKIALP